jgi:succinate dehydrogenase/fumarate reductase cytochrome b subunit
MMPFWIILGFVILIIALGFVMLGLRIFVQNKDGIQRHCINDKNKSCFCSDEQREKCRKEQ